jgi:sugar phosphate isomerase/epimerase
MQLTLNRRDWLKSLGLAAAGAGLAPLAGRAVEPFERQGPPRLALSLAAYSFRKFFKDGKDADAGVPEQKRMDLFRFLDFCAAHGCQGAELTSYYFPKDTDDAFLLRVRRHAFLRGVDISGTAVGNTFTHPPGEKRDQELALVKRWIDRAAVLGAPHIRVFAGAVPRGVAKEEAMKHCIAALEECAAHGARKGVFLGIENHGGIVAEAADLLAIVRAVQTPWVGINLDTGNFHSDDPYGDLARCAPFAVNVQVKSELRARGQKKAQADLPRMVKILRDAGYQGYVALEYEAEPDPWTAVPPLLKEMKTLLAG